MTDAVNWIIQGVLLAVVATACARLWRRAPAAARYALWWTTLAAIVTLPALALWTRLGPAGDMDGRGFPPLVAMSEPAAPAAMLLLVLWAGWSLPALVRLGAAAGVIRSIKRTCTAFPAARQRGLTHWRRVSGRGRRARLAVSARVNSAAVLGGRIPVIAVSPALLRHLNDDELDHILLHEWVHVQRRDDVAQVVQQVARALLGLHPAVWWATRQIQLECELACDERVARLIGSSRTYAASLVKLAGIVRLPHPAAAMPSALGASQTATRVLRLVEQSRGRVPRLPAMGMAAGVLLLAGAAALSLSVQFVGGLAPRTESIVRSAGLPDAGPLSRASRPRASLPALEGTARRPRIRKRTEGAGAASAAGPASPSGSRAAIEEQFTAVQPVWRALRVPLSGDASLTRVPGTSIAMRPPASLPPDAAESATPWSAAASAGIAIGRKSTNAAQVTAEFFTRMGKSMGGRF